MIAEALLHATATSRPDLRRRGLVGDAVALWSRATRQRRAWADHEMRCRAFVRSCLDGLPNRRTALVLGSGLLRDVPVADLARSFERVVLVDAVHLWPSRRLARRLGCEMIIADLSVLDTSSGTQTPSGGELCPPPCGPALGRREGRANAKRSSGVGGHALGGAPGPPPGSASPSPPSPQGAGQRPDLARRGALAVLMRDATVDLVVSANVLSQLPMSLLRDLPDGDPAETAARNILQRHLDDLAAFRGRICLLSDVAYRDVDPDGRTIDEIDLMHGLALPAPHESWDWTVAPRGEIDRDFARLHRVQAWRDFQGGAG